MIAYSCFIVFTFTLLPLTGIEKALYVSVKGLNMNSS